MTRKYRFGTEEIEAPAELTTDQVRAIWAEVLPGVENAEIEEVSDGSVNFTVRAGTKG
jgi:hypothetical protein